VRPIQENPPRDEYGAVSRTKPGAAKRSTDVTTANANPKSSDKLLEEIRETNLTYLMLAQHMIRQDRAEALYRLGISAELADLIERLSPAQLLKIAAGNILMCKFRFDDQMIWDLLTSHSKDAMARTAHAAILMSGQLAEVV
jgi:flagellar transcriptional activator FlhD